jgi:hypothetical protein
MDRFLIEIPHREQNCPKLIQLLHTQGHLKHFVWGCPSGVHTGWAVLEADNEAELSLIVPQLVRGQARVQKVHKFDAPIIAQMHAGKLVQQSPDLARMYTTFPCWW